MAKQPKAAATTISDVVEQETVEQPKAQAKKSTVVVRAKHPLFVDLINNVNIGETPKEVELHPWLQANIDAGLLIVSE